MVYSTHDRQHRRCFIPKAVNTVYCSWRLA